MNYISAVALVGALTPILIAIIQQEKWSDPVRAFAGFGVCLVMTVITTFISGNLDLTHWVSTAAVIYGAAMATFHGLWKPTNIADAIEAASTKLTTSTPKTPVGG